MMTFGTGGASALPVLAPSFAKVLGQPKLFANFGTGIDRVYCAILDDLEI